MRVALVSSDTSPQSGAARCLLRLAVGLKQRGDEPVLLLSDMTGIAVDARQSGIEVHSTRAGRPHLRRGWRGVAAWAVNFPLGTVALAWQLRRLRVNIVHANEFIELQAGVAAKLARLPCVYHVRWPLGTSLVERCVARLVMALSVGLIFVSSATRDLFLRAAGSRRTSRMWVIHDPGPELTEPGPGVREEVRREFGVPADSPLVLQVSKLIPHKGQHLFLEAAALVANSVRNVHFIMAGGEVPGHEAYAREIAALASQEPLRGKVTLAGYREDVSRLMAAADIVVHTPTIAESFPGVTLEAMAAGRAIIAARIGGMPEQIEHGVTGILVKPGRADELAQAMLRLLGDPESRARLGATAQGAYPSRFGRGQHAATVAKVYLQFARR